MAELRSPDATMRTLKRAINSYIDAVAAGDIKGPDGEKYSTSPTEWDPSTTYEQAANRATRAFEYLDTYMAGEITETRSHYLTPDMSIDEGMAAIDAHGEHTAYDSIERRRQAVLKIYWYLLLYLYGAGTIDGEGVYLTERDVDLATADSYGASTYDILRYDGIAATIGGTRTSQGYIDELSINWSWQNLDLLSDSLDESAGDMSAYRVSHLNEDSTVGYVYLSVYEYGAPKFKATIEASWIEDIFEVTPEAFRVADAITGVEGEVLFAEESVAGRVKVTSMAAEESAGLKSRFGFETTGLDASSAAQTISDTIMSFARDLASERFRLIRSFDNVRARNYSTEDKKAILDEPASQFAPTTTEIAAGSTTFVQELLYAGGETRADVVQAIAQAYSIFYGSESGAQSGGAGGGGSSTGGGGAPGY